MGAFSLIVVIHLLNRLMGNGASVKKVKTQKEQVGDNTPHLSRSNSAGVLETPRVAARQLRGQNEQLLTEVDHLREQVGWLESAKLDLEDRVETITGQCDDLKLRNTEFVTENIKIRAEMRKLQSDLGIKTEAFDSIQRELNEMKQSAKGRSRQTQRKMAEFKQSLSLQLFELRQENEDLKSILYSSNSTDLQPRTSGSDTRTSANTTATDSGMLSRELTTASDEIGMGDTGSIGLSASQSNLVVQLSSKITEQQLEIERLKQKLPLLQDKSLDDNQK